MYVFVAVAVILAVYFFSQAWGRSSLAALVAGILWLAYAVWEFLIGYGVLCDANCNIRVDLILILPLLCIATLLACVTSQQWSAAIKVVGVIGFVLFLLLAVPLAYVLLFEEPSAQTTGNNTQPPVK